MFIQLITCLSTDENLIEGFHDQYGEIKVYGDTDL